MTEFSRIQLRKWLHLDGCGFQPDQGVAVINPATAKEERAGIIAALDVLLDDSLRVCVPDI